MSRAEHRAALAQDVAIARAHADAMRDEAGRDAPISDSRLRVARAIEGCARAAEADETDNGYTNHETFSVAMQLAGNMTPGGGEYRETVERIGRLRMRAPLGDTADALREHVETLAVVRAAAEHPDLAGDLMLSALGRVDWYELAEELRGELREQYGADADGVSA
jgi:hypothetical protein